MNIIHVLNFFPLWPLQKSRQLKIIRFLWFCELVIFIWKPLDERASESNIIHFFLLLFTFRVLNFISHASRAQTLLYVLCSFSLASHTIQVQRRLNHFPRSRCKATGNVPAKAVIINARKISCYYIYGHLLHCKRCDQSIVVFKSLTFRVIPHYLNAL